MSRCSCHDEPSATPPASALPGATPAPAAPKALTPHSKEAAYYEQANEHTRTVEAAEKKT